MEIKDTIYLVIALVSALFGVIMWVRRPQEKSEVTDAVYAEKFSSLEKLVLNLRDNHLHTMESKLDLHIEKQHCSDMDNARQHEQILTKLDFLIKK